MKHSFTIPIYDENTISYVIIRQEIGIANILDSFGLLNPKLITDITEASIGKRLNIPFRVSIEPIILITINSKSHKRLCAHFLS